MALPTEPGLYSDPPNEEVWLLREDGLWENIGRPLPFGGIDLYPEGPFDGRTAEELERLDRPYGGGTLPCNPIDALSVPRWYPEPPSWL